MDPLLDNPLWGALTTVQAGLAMGDGGARRYAADVAPFLALAAPDAIAEGEALLAPGEVVSLIGVVPAATSLEVEVATTLLQLVATAPVLGPFDEAGLEPLGAADAPAMLALTAIAFPGYFRPRTHVMGRYFGIRAGGTLVAMAGERLALPGHREISGVCTHPDHVGRGHARRLCQRLMALHAAEGLTSFLHVAPGNAGAFRLYEGLGFARRAELPLWRVRRP